MLGRKVIVSLEIPSIRNMSNDLKDEYQDRSVGWMPDKACEDSVARETLGYHKVKWSSIVGVGDRVIPTGRRGKDTFYDRCADIKYQTPTTFSSSLISFIDLITCLHLQSTRLPPRRRSGYSNPLPSPLDQCLKPRS